MFRKSKHSLQKALLTVCALFLIASLLFSTAYASPNPLAVRTVTDWDENFPLSLDPVIDPDSIRLLPSSSTISDDATLLQPSTAPISLDASQYVSTTIAPTAFTVDTEMLDVSLRISLKEAFDYGNSYTLKIHRDGEFLVNDVYHADDVIVTDRLAYNEPYTIDLEVEDDDKITEYVGTFFYGIDFDNTVFVSMQYSTLESFKNQAQYVGHVTESESNNTVATADTCQWGQTFRGTLSNSSDIDFIKLVNPDNKFRRINAVLRNESNTTMYFRVYYGSESKQIGISIVSPNSCDYLSLFIPDTLSGNYYFKVTDKDGNASNSAYRFNANLGSAKVWYSQFGGYAGGIHYWNTELLDQISFSGKPFVNNSGTNSVLGGTGCALASAAMVFRNYGYTSKATMTDIRTGQVGNLMADPFTVYMANNGMTTLPYTTSSSGYSTTASTNVSMKSWSGIGKSFNFSGCTLTNYSNSDAQTVKNQIRSLLYQNNWGVVLWFKLGTRSHYLVAVGYENDASGNVKDIIVCDPYTLDPSRGDNVLFANSISANRTDGQTSYTWANLAAYNIFK